MGGNAKRLTPLKETLIRLFAKSGNRCAFQECRHEMIDKDNEFVGQICHIESAQEGGQRFNENSTDEYRRSYDNLILMCYKHHRKTNNVEKYPVSELIKMKLNHEKRYLEDNFGIDNEVLDSILQEMDEYWDVIEHINNYAHIALDLKLK